MDYSWVPTQTMSTLPMPQPLEYIYQTPLGHLYQADCLELLPMLPAESVDTIF